jgi:hypothetical protein
MHKPKGNIYSRNVNPGFTVPKKKIQNMTNTPKHTPATQTVPE